MDALDRLRRSMLFSELNPEEMQQLGEIVSFRRLARGGMLFLEGDPATGFFVLISGRVRIFKSSAEGKEYNLHQVNPGQIFAEAAIFKGHGYPANCQATADSELAFFPKDEFLALVTRYPQIALKIMGGLASWLREFTVKLEDLSLKEVPTRLAEYLLLQSRRWDSAQITLPTSKAELAKELGTIPETLSRNFKKLKDAGLIAVSGKQISILDPVGLQVIAEGGKI